MVPKFEAKKECTTFDYRSGKFLRMTGWVRPESSSSTNTLQYSSWVLL